jgi:hypothetical protein
LKQECSDIFSKGGGETMAKDFGLEFLGKPFTKACRHRAFLTRDSGRLPIDPKLSTLMEASGGTFCERFQQSILYPIFGSITSRITTDS